MERSRTALPTAADTIEAQNAEQVWKIASRLQAEAARRLEARSKQIAQNVEPAQKSYGSGFSLDEVKAIAEEAGIEAVFVEQALREIAAAGLRPVPLSDQQEAWASRFLGTDQERLTVTRTIPAPVEEVLEAMKRVFPRHPYDLKLVEIIGDPQHLKDTTLVFEVPQLQAMVTDTGGYTAFSYHMSISDLKQLFVSMHPLNDHQTEVTLQIDMAYGKGRNLKFGAWFTGIIAGIGGIVGGLVGLKTGDAVTPMVLGGLSGTLGTGWLSYWGYRVAYHWGLRKGREALEELLRALDVDARTQGAFTLPNKPSPPAGSGLEGMLPLLTP
jgi:hypothetical protein